jgi:hypothetical protein
MPTQFPRVNPGDVIQAQQWNSILDAIEYLYGQLGTVVTTNVQITGFQPPGPVNVGDPISVLGRNFEYSIGAVGLYFESVRVDSFLPGSGDSQLNVTVPSIPNLPPGGRLVTVTAYNRTSNDQKTLTVVPIPLPLSGFVDVIPGAADTTQPGARADFQFTINSRANQAATFTVVANVDQQGWTTQILNPDKSPMSNSQLQLVPFQPAIVYARLTVPANAVQNTPFNVTLNVSSGATVFGTTGPVQHTVGQPDTPQDPSISIQQASANPPSALLQGATISAPVSSLVTITVPTTFTFTPQAAYTVSIGPVGPLSNWPVRMVNPSGPVSTPQDPSSSGTFTPPVGNVQNLQFAVQPAQGASATGTLQLRIQRQGATTAATKNFPVSLAQS